MARKKQMPKGYRQRQHDKQLERWKHFLRKEKKKLKKTGEVITMTKKPTKQNDAELVELAEEIQLLTVERNQYRVAYEAERKTAEYWLEDSRAQRKEVKRLRKIAYGLLGATMLLSILIIGILGGNLL